MTPRFLRKYLEEKDLADGKAVSFSFTNVINDAFFFVHFLGKKTTVYVAQSGIFSAVKTELLET